MLFSFEGFELDVGDAILRHATREVPLTPKAFAVLHYLVERANHLVTKLELWQAVWPGVIVTDAALTVCMSEIRKALEDTPRSPRYIATVHRRGYRFVAPVQRVEHTVALPERLEHLAAPIETPNCCGREIELGCLDAWWSRAYNGRRTLAFISGEPGIGKTTLIQSFLARRDIATKACAAQGQCIEHFGTGEPYLPILDALGRMCRGPLATPLVLGLERHAPGWLLQMPGLLDDERLATLRERAAGTPPERMLRELSDALDAVAREVPMVIVLEDLHWSDHATLDWLGFIARRQEPARMLVLCTYRPVEVIVNAHPLRALKQELRAHALCEEIHLGLLSEAAVGSYLATRFGTVDRISGETQLHPSLGAFAQPLHRRTDGNPLFVDALVEELVARGQIVEHDGFGQLVGDPEDAVKGIPEAPQQLIAGQLSKVSGAAHALLEAASVLGLVCSCAPLAAVLGMSVAEIETTAAGLIQRGQFLRSTLADDGADELDAACFAFAHALHREVVYENIDPGRRSALHRALGQALEGLAGERAPATATELALHFERGREAKRAAYYYRVAGAAAAEHSAYADARALLERGLGLLGKVPASASREREELALRLGLGPVLIALTGNASPEVAACYERARELYHPADPAEALFKVLFGLRSHAVARGDLGAAHELGAELFAIAEQSGDSGLRLEACVALGNTYFQLGHPAQARIHLEQGATLYAPALHGGHSAAFGMDPGMFCLSLLALSLQLLGEPDEALRRSGEALALAASVDHSYSLATAENFAGWFHQLRGEPAAAQRHTAAALGLCVKLGFPSAQTLATIRHAWACAMNGDVANSRARIEDGIDNWSRLGARLARAHFLALHAEVCGAMNDPATGLTSIDEALDEIARTGERWLAAELYRIRGQLLAEDPAHEDGAVEAWRTALGIARGQEARFLELRAALQLAEYWAHQGCVQDITTLLEPILARCTPSLDCAEYALAHRLLEQSRA